MDNFDSNKILENILIESGILEVFGINQDHIDLKSDREGLVALIGFLKEAAEGNIADPNDLLLWEKTGELIFNDNTHRVLN